MPSPTTHAAPTGTESHDAFKDTQKGDSGYREMLHAPTTFIFNSIFSQIPNCPLANMIITKKPL
jgi:hypothetical protein